MTRATRAAAVALIVLLALVVFINVRPVDASHAGQWHWATTAAPFRLTVVDATDWDLAALADWEGEVDFEVIDGPAVDRQSCPFDLTPGRVVICNADYGATGWLGATSLQAGTHNGQTHLQHARIRLNDHYQPNPNPTPTPSVTPKPDPTPKTCKGKGNPHCLKSDGTVEGLVCHEMGHALGLAHLSDSASCMQSPGGGNEPTAHDLEQLRLIYAHLDTEWCATVPVWTGIPCLD